MEREKEQNIRSVFDSWHVSQDEMPSMPETIVDRSKEKSVDDYYWQFLKNEIARLTSLVIQAQEKEYREKQAKPIERVKIISFMIVMTMYFLISLPYLLVEGQEIFFATSVVLAGSMASIYFLLFLEFKQ